MRLRLTRVIPCTLAAMLMSLWSLPCSAEDEGQLWSKLGVRYRATKWLRLGFDQHVRFDQDITELQSVMPQLGVQFRFIKYLHLGVGYRFIHERSKSGDFEQAHRVHADALARVRIAWIRLDHRLRFQETFEDGEYKSALRNRLRFKLALWDRVRPFGAAELFNRFGDSDGFRLSKFRVTAGTSLRLADHSIDVFYRYELPLDDTDDARLHILGLGYRFDLPKFH